jgi:hypothetical protein
MKACATGATPKFPNQKYFELTSANQINDAFKAIGAIGTAITRLRVAK